MTEAQLTPTSPEAEQTTVGNPQALRYAEDIARMNALRRAYERLLPVPLDPLAPGLPETTVREATILFTDLRGFTGMAERFESDPNGLLAVLNEHFGVVVRAIVRCGGVVEKFLGDGVFATFGAWREDAEHASRALAAAIGVVGANEALNRRRADAWGFRLNMGAALCAGKVLVGPVGPPDRCELGVIGDAVNVAARLVQDARGGEVLLAASAHQTIAGQVTAELVGTRPIRGRVGPLRVYRLQCIETE